ncbi:conserved protein, unknown function [Hepatocystis sp. ex Piliocolobus tephrosceles]|nr:conserved protein, unknown function [Hepatocystis sp. ex Piliocolobus tephrosceles]
MITSLFFLFIFIYHFKHVALTKNNPGEQPEPQFVDNTPLIDEEWRLYPLATNPFMDLQHPNMIGDFVRCVDEYYVFETKKYNKYKKERYRKIKENKQFPVKHHRCAIHFLIHGRPDSQVSTDPRMWSVQANILKDGLMQKGIYDKYVVHAPYVSMLNFCGKNGMNTHSTYAFIVANRISVTLKNILNDDTCCSYDLAIHSHCVGMNMTRLFLTLNDYIWDTLDINYINFEFESEILAILDENFKLTLEDVDIVQDKTNIELRKDQYYKFCTHSLYKNYVPTENKKYNIFNFDYIFYDYNFNYDILIKINYDGIFYTDIMYLGEINNEPHPSHGFINAYDNTIDPNSGESSDDNVYSEYVHGTKTSHRAKVLRSIKRLHYYLLHIKIRLGAITSTVPPLTGNLTHMEDIKVGYQKYMKYKCLLKVIPECITYKKLKTRDMQEMLHVVNPQLFCTLALSEKINYNYFKNVGSLMTYFNRVSYYSDLDNDEMISMYTALGLYSNLYMRSLSYYLLNFRNEYYLRTYNIPVHFSNINISENSGFFDYIKHKNVCSIINKKHLERFIAYLNEVINYEQKPKPFIAERYVYKNPYLEHFVVPFESGNTTYMPHTIIGTARSFLLIYSYDIYRHIATNTFDLDSVNNHCNEYYNDLDPFIYYNWLTYVENQTRMDQSHFMHDIVIYSENLNMNLVENLFDMFVSSHYIKIFIFNKLNLEDHYRYIFKKLEKFSLPTNGFIIKQQIRKPRTFDIFIHNELTETEHAVYEYISKYSNFLQNYINTKAYYILSDSLSLFSQTACKDIYNHFIAEFKHELRKILCILKDNNTFDELRYELQRTYNLKNMCNDKDMEEYLYNELDPFSTFKNLCTKTVYDNNIDMIKSYIQHYGYLFHVNRDISLSAFFQKIKLNDSSNEKIQYIQFVLKSVLYGQIEDHLNESNNIVNSCLFSADEGYKLSYISYFCSYNQRYNFTFKKQYVSHDIYSIKSLADCDLEPYIHFKICENAALLTRFFKTSLDVVISNLHKREKKRMEKMKRNIENNIKYTDIFTLKNDSLVTILHKNIATIKVYSINACFKVSKHFYTKNPFMFNNTTEETTSTFGYSQKPTTSSTDEYDPNISHHTYEDPDLHMFCVKVQFPAFTYAKIIDSINNIYLRGIHKLIKNKKFLNYLNLYYNNNYLYENIVYVFDKIAYVYDHKLLYKPDNINSEIFMIPQIVTWGFFNHLLGYHSQTKFNNEFFLRSFFYEEKTNVVYPVVKNVYNDFMKHIVIFFDLFKVMN